MSVNSMDADYKKNVALICTTYNCKEELRSALETVISDENLSLLKEIVIVDGGSEDGTWEMLQEWASKISCMEVYRIPSANISRGRNEAIKRTTSEIIVTFDTGTKYCDEWLKHMLRPFWEDPEMHVVDGVTVGMGETLFQKVLCVFYKEYFVPESSSKKSDGPAIKGGASHRCIAYRRVVWEKIGGYPENVQAGEDTWFNTRIMDLGMKVTASPDAKCYWMVREGFKALWKMTYRNASGHLSLRGNRGAVKVYGKMVLNLLVITCAMLGFWIPLAWWLSGVLYLAYLASQLLRKTRRAFFINPVHFLYGVAITLCTDCAMVFACFSRLLNFVFPVRKAEGAKH
jgi:glycosyltransferase involved in cell wall biosynthesis